MGSKTSSGTRHLLVLGDRPTGALAPALEHALVAGGDARLHIDVTTRMNVYGCQPGPRSQEISYSSSTASTISTPAYARVEAAFRELCGATAQASRAEAVERLAEGVRREIHALFDLPRSDVDIVLSPSGTDSELQALFLAGCALRRPLTSIIPAADETGNGMTFAAAGRHFNTSTSAGRSVIRGKPVAGLAPDRTILIPVRDEHGYARPLAAIDENVRRAVAEAVAAGGGAVLHVMDHSKLGTSCPSAECLRDFRSKWRNSILIVVDACQGRLSRGRLRWYLDQGFLVQVTGSKFFAGPPLSGALLVPKSAWPPDERLNAVPAGLADYTAAYDWPESRMAIREQLPRRTNIGQWLRWVAALEEIRAYFRVPELFRRLATAEFGAAVTRTIDRYPELQLLPESEEAFPDPAGANEEFGVRTIFPFVVSHQGRALSLRECRVLWQALNQDVRGLNPALRHSINAGLAAQLCHLGQPVAIADGSGGAIGALRISADARLASESWVGAGELLSTRRLQEKFDQIGVVFEKLRLLLPHIDELVGAVEG